MQNIPVLSLLDEGVAGAKAGAGAAKERSAASFSHMLQQAAGTGQVRGLTEVADSPRGLSRASREEVIGLLDAKASSLSAEAGEALGVVRRLAARSGDSAGGGAQGKARSWGLKAPAAGENAAKTAGGESMDSALKALLLAAGGAGRRPDLSVRGLNVTREDFAALKQGLAKYGFTSAELAEIEARVNAKNGLTWGGLVSVAARKMAGQDAFPVELSLDQVRAIQNFFQKAGCTPQEAEELLNKLRRGESPAVWQAVQAKLAVQPEGAALELDAAEIGALSKALRLTQGNDARLRTLIQEDGSARLSIKDLKAVLAELKGDAASAQADRGAESAALRELVAGAFEQARERAEVAARADRRPGEEARRTRLLAEDAKDEREAKGKEHRPLSGENADSGKDESGFASRLPGGGRSRAAERAGDQGGEGLSGDGRHAGRDARGAARDGAGSARQGAAASEGDSAWTEFWGKVAKDRAAKAEVRAESPTRSAETLAGLGREAGVQARPEAVLARSGSGLENFSSRDVLRQVESGIYRNLGEGSRQLTLRLDPPELGKLSLVLTVRGQEVSAVLKPESAEAGRMLQDGLGQIRQALEAQGLKVGKLEVQTQLADGGQGHNAWSGADRHNEAQAREESSRALDRLRNLRLDGEGLAQEMQSGEATAIRSHEGLSIFA